MSVNKVQILDANTQSFLKRELLDFSSRYNNIRFIKYSNFEILTLETYDRVYNPSSPDRNRKVAPGEVLFFNITKGTQYKPWLVSQDAYGDPGYWWFIMEFNNFFDIEDFTAGKTIEIPPLTALSAAISERSV
jgi:hypothetical protein